MDILQVVYNKDNTYTIVFKEWSITASIEELDSIFKRCFNKSILIYLKNE